MAYNSWKMMDKIDVAIKTSPDNTYYGRTFNGYVVEHGDEKSLESAKSWAFEREYDREKREYTTAHEPAVHTFDNNGFTVKILKSAGGSSQGGRLSFMACEIEKDGVKFVIGVNDELLVDLIRNSTIVKGVVQEKVMFVRKSGRPGFIHEGMEAYQEANADMKLKADMKKAKKTSKWELGGVYKTLTQMSVCLGKAYDLYEEYDSEGRGGYYSRYYKALRKREKPVEVTVWVDVYRFEDQDTPKTFAEILEEKMEDRDYVYFSTGKPPARAKSEQLEVTDADVKLVDKFLSLRKDTSYENHGNSTITNRFVREIK